MTRFIAVEGCHGTGTSTHADALAAALAARGTDAVAWHHPPHPAGSVGAERVRHYCESRRWSRWLELTHTAHAVYVLDRGPWSGVVYAQSLVSAGETRLLSGFVGARLEVELWWDHLQVICLDAPDDVLDARLAQRGEDPATSHAERRVWRRMAAAQGWPVVSTDGDREAVEAQLLALALRP